MVAIALGGGFAEPKSPIQQILVASAMLSASLAEMGWSMPLGSHLNRDTVRRAGISMHGYGTRTVAVADSYVAGDVRRMLTLGSNAVHSGGCPACCALAGT